MEDTHKRIMVNFFILIVVFSVSMAGNTYLGELNKLNTTETTVDLGEKEPRIFLPVRIVRETTEAIKNALFDITISLPEKPKEGVPAKDLLVSVNLINFGEPGKINVSINYILTNSNGDIILIEHEKRTIETQMSFLKTIELPELPPDSYKIYAELMYSNTSAIAAEQFDILGRLY